MNSKIQALRDRLEATNTLLESLYRMYPLEIGIESVLRVNRLVLAKTEEKPQPIVQWDVDAASYVGDEEDGVYWLAAEKNGRWYVTVVVDSNSGSFVMDIDTDAGPFDTEKVANEYGRNAATDWCIDNRVDWSA